MQNRVANQHTYNRHNDVPDARKPMTKPILIHPCVNSSPYAC